MQHLPGNIYVVGVGWCDKIPGILSKVQCELELSCFYLLGSAVNRTLNLDAYGSEAVVDLEKRNVIL